MNTLRTIVGALTMLSVAAVLTGCVVTPVAPRVVYAPPPPAPEPPPPADAATAAPAASVDTTATASVTTPPPPLPTYEQPPCPAPGYLWTPGYWAWGLTGYYWVPGTWVQPPSVGLLWTPGYWGFVGGVYTFNAGYWGPHVGFYGGVNYGFGYGGVGFAGGQWVGSSFSYNQAVANVNVSVVHNTYNQTVVNNVNVGRVSYNGGAGGVAATPTPQERAWAHEPHVPPTAIQHEHIQQAARNPALAASANGGHPSIAATPRPGAFNAPGVMGAHGPGAAPGAPAPASGHSGPGAQGYGGRPASSGMAGHGSAPPRAGAHQAPRKQPPKRPKAPARPEKDNKK